MIRTTRMTRICTRIATPSTIIGRAASTGMTRTTTDMMTVTTDFGTRGSFSYSKKRNLNRFRSFLKCSAGLNPH